LFTSQITIKKNLVLHAYKKKKRRDVRETGKRNRFRVLDEGSFVAGYFLSIRTGACESVIVWFQ
jgi:hypothetical protein